MKKIPTLFVRNPDDRRYVLPEVTPGCEWVIAGEGVATRKYDGTCVMRDAQGMWWARREVKPGKQPPGEFVAVEHDEGTGKTVGWEPAADSPFWRWLLEAVWADADPGTYELCGPKINGNPEDFEQHTLVRHADAEILDMFTHHLIDWWDVANNVPLLGWEGIVWHHPDGRMAKIKSRDFPS